MRYNKQDLVALASQTSQNFDKEGVLVLKERQDGFFRRSEGCSVRWFRLRGNLLFYLKGPEVWYEPMGVIVLGHHQINVQSQDENGHWPFQIGTLCIIINKDIYLDNENIALVVTNLTATLDVAGAILTSVWDNGVCYRMATFHEPERTLWLKAIQMAPYDHIKSQINALNEKLNKIRPIIDVTTFRIQKGTVTDMNEVPLCELALSCDNLLCDAYGRPPSPLVIIYVKYPTGVCVRYGATEIVKTCSNPCFSKTILFRASDGLTGDCLVRMVAYDVREQVSETAVPMGFTSFQLSTIQEAQRLRVALLTRENKTVGFVTINGWSLEPSYIGTSPSHNNDKNSIDIPQKCHKRSQSLPPRLGLKLKFPSYGTLLKQNFVNSHQVTYRFHSGLGGDITVHEIMAEAKLCYNIPIQLLDIYILREKELVEELLSVDEMCGQLHRKQLELISTHISVLKYYCHMKKCMQNLDKMYFKPSNKKDDVSLEFAPVNLHLQRMWVHNDTLNKTGFHDVVTVGAFAAHHTHKSENTDGLIRLVQQVKDVNSSKAALNSATANKIEAEYDNVLAIRRLREEVVLDSEKAVVSLQANQKSDVFTLIEALKSKVKIIIALWEPNIVEETLSCIGWPRKITEEKTINRLTEQLRMFDTNSDYDDLDVSSSSSSKDTSPTVDFPSLSSSVPNICPNVCSINHKESFKEITEGTELQFHNNYFKSERDDRSSLNNSFISVCLPLKQKSVESSYGLSYESKSNSLRQDFKSSASLEQVSYRSLIDTLSGKDKRKNPEVRRESLPVGSVSQLDPTIRESNLLFLKGVGKKVEEAVTGFSQALTKLAEDDNGVTSNEELERIQYLTEAMKGNIDELLRWSRTSHAALRLRCEMPQWSREHTALQTRRDTCFSQALTTVSTGLLCWLCSVPADVVVRLLGSGLGPLCGFEGLLSLYSSEKAMWGDMVVAVEDLQTVQFTLSKVGHSNSVIPHVSGTRGALTVHIPISDSLHSKFASKKHMTFTITAVFFNIGINEKATLAEALGETTPQYHSNSDNLDRLNKYYHKYCKVFPADHMAASRASSRTKPLEEVMENLRTVVQKKVPKNVEVLHLAALATRLMNGIRFTSCKSAKDRTGMSVTLEQCSILSTEYHLAEHEQKKALSIMRSEGCRRENTYKNIGVKKYAFTKKQVAALPADYQPPPGTYGSSQT